MNDCELCLKNFDIEEVMSSGEYDEIYSKISAFQDCLKELLYEKEYEKFKEHLVYQERINAWISAKYEAEKNITYLVGRFLGYLSAMELNIESYYKNLSSALLSEQLLSAEIPHLDDILFSIEKNEGIRHGQLAEAIGIDKSTLTGIMEKIVSIGAAYFSRPGKFKYYYLTTDGKNYCEENREKYKETLNLNSQIEELTNEVRDLRKTVDSLHLHSKNTPNITSLPLSDTDTFLPNEASDGHSWARFSDDPTNSYKKIIGVNIISTTLTDDVYINFNVDSDNKNVGLIRPLAGACV